jgi:hypothetical protein
MQKPTIATEAFLVFGTNQVQFAPAQQELAVKLSRSPDLLLREHPPQELRIADIRSLLSFSFFGGLRPLWYFPYE